MSTTQLFFSMAGLFLVVISAQTTVLVLYINAKIDPVAKQVDKLTDFMVNHAERISSLETKTSKL